jgi:hypothetical protein
MPETVETKDAEVVPSEPKKPKAKGNGKTVADDTSMVPRGDVDMLMVEAVRSGNIEVMERVMSIRRELKAEAAKEAFFAAMAAFRSECPVIQRTKPVWNKEHTRIMYHYAPLDQIEKVVGPIIARYGLSYSFKAHIERPADKDAESDLVMECYVNHESGHVEISPFRLPISGDYMNKNQQRGNTNSYAKRYSFCNGFGIMTEDEDDDAAERGRVSPEDARKARQPVSQPRPTPTAQKAAQRGNTAPAERVQLEPAGEGEGIDEKIATGIWKAMEYGSLGMSDFKKRFPKLTRLGEIKRGNEQVVMDWIADPVKN